MHKKILVSLGLFLIAALVVPLAADARYRYSGRYSGALALAYTNNPWKYAPTVTTASTTAKPTTTTSTTTTKPTTTTSTTTTKPMTTTTTTITTTASSQSVPMYITGYSYWDNTPAGTAEISNGVIHTKAGGTGTYTDPITLAVGHSIISGKDILDYPAGTKFYLPYIQKYVIVEDTCGDGNTPQNGPCHTGFQGNPWIDVYVDGKNVSQSSSDSCMNKITGVHSVIKNPASNLPVTVGSITESGCKTF